MKKKEKKHIEMEKHIHLHTQKSQKKNTKLETVIYAQKTYEFNKHDLTKNYETKNIQTCL